VKHAGTRALAAASPCPDSARSPCACPAPPPYERPPLLPCLPPPCCSRSAEQPGSAGPLLRWVSRHTAARAGFSARPPTPCRCPTTSVNAAQEAGQGRLAAACKCRVGMSRGDAALARFLADFSHALVHADADADADADAGGGGKARA
jgi:hypothetical protein